MDSRKFLDKIRKMQEYGEKIGLTENIDVKNEKSNLMENVFKFPVITEGIDDEEGQDISPDEQRDEENTFKDTVTQLVEFQPIKVFRQNVKWSGRLVREGISWVYTLEDSIGCYISTDDDSVLQLTDDNLRLLQKIRAYYDTWQDEWSSRLTGGSPEPEEGGEEMGGF
tara:strand:+ start:851 stop:1354 length:504 start_codon:yes stop_codon:yes gene_type:complete